jgi:Spy/CpxP family protein refolding chaperone
MKLAKIIAAAGLTVAAVTMSTSADAQSWRHDRGHHSSWDRGHHRGWDNHHNRHHRYCRTEWRHHHRVTICR